MRKYADVEKAKVVSPDGHKAVEQELHKLGKTSASNLSDEERENVKNALDKSDK